MFIRNSEKVWFSHALLTTVIHIHIFTINSTMRFSCLLVTLSFMCFSIFNLPPRISHSFGGPKNFWCDFYACPLSFFFVMEMKQHSSQYTLSFFTLSWYSVMCLQLKIFKCFKLCTTGITITHFILYVYVFPKYDLNFRYIHTFPWFS